MPPPLPACAKRSNLLRALKSMAARGSVRGVLVSVVLGVVVVAACGGNSTYGAAAVGLGATVLASGINRVATGACWANCTKGYYCDHESGVCQRGECDPSCREGDYCVKEANGYFRCVAPAGTYPLGKAPPPSASSANDDAGAPAPLAPFVDAGATPASDSDDTTAADGGVQSAADASVRASSGADVDGASSLGADASADAASE